ncbi:unnamed protein product [Cladocopium goreaui]|uniref:ABC1 atypical kinase-like domain-containing protein n=1 Tax=Cladocopium goreaui TaxID=2562237 RepID=A0A9P1FTW5_9DINO|nr:unnamed protein product [Cladocopium goreaui]
MSWWLRFASLDPTDGAYFAGLHEKYAPKVMNLLVKQGGIFVKIGQMLSLLPKGVLPEPYLREFKTLQTRVPPRPGSEVRQLISEALGAPLESVFSDFDDVPIGSASIGQVHKATLRLRGLEVVIKVQYPEVSRSIAADFANAERIVWLLDKSKVDDAREARKHHLEELDFQQEASNLLRVRQGLSQKFPEVKVPEPILEFCRPTVLVMTRLEGHSLLDAIMDMAEASRRWRLGAVTEFRPSLRIPDATKLKLLQLCMSASRSARNFGVALYNASAGRFGANKLSYSRSLCCFDTQEMCRKLWLIHGHQVLVDGVFSITALRRFVTLGQVPEKEMDLSTRLLIAHLLLALAADDDDDIAHWYQELGMSSRNGSVELLALNAKVKFGHASILSKETFERYKVLNSKDSLSRSENGCLCRLERLVQVLRGTSFLLGAPNYGTTLWAAGQQAFCSGKRPQMVSKCVQSTWLL